MTVTIAPNIKKNKIFLDKNGNQITEDQLFANKGVGSNMGTNPRTNPGGQEEKSTQG